MDFSGLSIWDALEDEGGARVAELRDIVAFSDRWTVEEGWSCTIEVGAADAQRGFIVRGQIIRVESPNESVREYRIASHTDGRSGDADTIVIQGQDPLLDLAEKTVLLEVGSGGVVSFDGGAVDLTPEDYLDSFAMPAAQASGIAVDTGTVEPDLPLTLDWSVSNSLALIRQVIAAIRDRGVTAELDYRRDPGNGYLVDILTEIGSTATAPELHVGRHVERWERTHSRADQASVVVPLGGVDGTGSAATIARAAWKVTAINGGTNTLTVVDPLGGPGPVQIAGQANIGILGDWYVEVPSTGALEQVVSATRVDALTTDVELADVSDFTVGDVFEFRSASGGTLMFLLGDPTAITALGAKIVPIQQEAGRGERNLIPNPWARDWSGGSAYPTPSNSPTGWAQLSSVVIYQDTDPLHARFSPNAIRAHLTAFAPGAVGGIFSPLANIYPVAGADLFSVTVSIEMLSPGSDIAIMLIGGNGAVLGEYVIPYTSLPPIGITRDYSVSGIDLTAAVGGVRVGVKGTHVTAQSGGGNTDVYIAAVQLTQTPEPADAYTEYSRATQLWQYGNQYLASFADPPPDFQVNLLDLARIDPTNWAHVELERGCTARLIDQGRGLDWDVRCVERVRNRMVAGDTTFTFSTRANSLVGSVVGIGPGGIPIPPVAPTPPPIDPPPIPVPLPVVEHPLPLVYAIHAGGLEGDLALANFPSATTERTPRTRARLFLRNATHVRLSAHVVTPLTGALYRAVYSRSGLGAATTWRGLDGASGPELPLDVAGDVVGDQVALELAAQDDVFVAFLEEGGDDASTVELGNFILHAHRGLVLGGTTECGLSGFTVQGDDFAGGNSPQPSYADTAAFTTWRGNARKDYVGGSGTYAIDATVSFNGRNTLKLTGGTAAKAWETQFTDDGDPTETSQTYDDFWVLYRIFAEPGTDWAEDTSSVLPPLQYLIQTWVQPASDFAIVAVGVRDGRLYLAGAYASVSNPDVIQEVDLGPAATLLEGGFADVILRVINNHDGSYTARAWCGPSCTASLARGGEVGVTLGADADFAFVNFYAGHLGGGGGPNAGKSLWVSTWEVIPTSVEANPFNVSNP